MTIQVNDALLGIWYVLIAPGDADWMAGLYKFEGRLSCAYRFKYYKEDDRKSWFEWTITGTPELAIEKVRFAARTIARANASEIVELLKVGKTDAEFMALLNAQPFLNVEEHSIQ